MLVGVLTISLIGGSAALATADGSQPIVFATVYQPQGATTDTVSLAELQANPQQCPQYSGQSMNELGRQGWTTVTLPPRGPQTGTWALATILKCLHTPISLGHVTGVTVIGASGTPEAGPNSQLTDADLATPSDFNDSAQSPVIEDEGSLTQYDRPWRGTVNVQQDYNFLDEVQGSQNGQPVPINIEVFEGPLLKVTATASQTTVKAGGTVNFIASVSPPNPNGLAYSWNFDGGAPNQSGSAPQVQFTSAGQYDVTVQATDAAGGGGAAAIPLTVTSTAGAPPTTAGTGPTTGPRHSSGNTPGGRPGHRSHAGGDDNDHGHNGNGTSATGTGAIAANRGGNDNGAGGDAIDSNRSVGTGTAGSSSHDGQRAADPAASHGPKPTNGQPRHDLSTGPRPPRVQGLLISNVTPLALASSPFAPTRQARPATAPALRTPSDRSPVPVIIAGLAILLLLCLGAERELRWLRGRRSLRFGS